MGEAKKRGFEFSSYNLDEFYIMHVLLKVH